MACLISTTHDGQCQFRAVKGLEYFYKTGYFWSKILQHSPASLAQMPAGAGHLSNSPSRLSPSILFETDAQQDLRRKIDFLVYDITSCIHIHKK